MLEAQQDLSPEVTLALISKVRRDSFSGANSHRHDLPRNIDAGFLLVVGDWARSPQSSPEPSATMIFEDFYWVFWFGSASADGRASRQTEYSSLA
jgi:hypothetical protein